LLKLFYGVARGLDDRINVPRSRCRINAGLTFDEYARIGCDKALTVLLKVFT